MIAHRANQVIFYTLTAQLGTICPNNGDEKVAAVFYLRN